MFVGSAKSHENPASVTSATPAMVIQWLVSRTIIGCFGSIGHFIFLRSDVQIGNQIRHLRAVEARPRDALVFIWSSMLGTMMPQRRDHRGGAKRAASSR